MGSVHLGAAGREEERAGETAEKQLPVPKHANLVVLEGDPNETGTGI